MEGTGGAAEMVRDAPGTTADVAVDVDINVNAVIATADVDNAEADLAPPPAASLASLIALGKLQDGEVLRCVKVRDWTEREGRKKKQKTHRRGIDVDS